MNPPQTNSTSAKLPFSRFSRKAALSDSRRGAPPELPTPKTAVPRASSQTFFITFFL